MATGIEIAVLMVVLVLVLVAATIVRALAPFIVNAVVGLLVLLGVEVVFGFSVAVTPVAVLVVAIGGVPGAIVVLLLSYLGVAFVA